MWNMMSLDETQVLRGKSYSDPAWYCGAGRGNVPAEEARECRCRWLSTPILACFEFPLCLECVDSCGSRLVAELQSCSLPVRWQFGIITNNLSTLVSTDTSYRRDVGQRYSLNQWKGRTRRWLRCSTCIETVLGAPLGDLRLLCL